MICNSKEELFKICNYLNEEYSVDLLNVETVGSSTIKDNTNKGIIQNNKNKREVGLKYMEKKFVIIFYLRKLNVMDAIIKMWIK